jgi:hypothetical protein
MYSARKEYLYLQSRFLSLKGVSSSTTPPHLLQEEKAFMSKNPPKDLKSVFGYCEFPGLVPLDPLIVDDNWTMWNESQRDTLIVRVSFI